jgi:hypothetical protein
MGELDIPIFSSNIGFMPSLAFHIIHIVLICP